MEPINLLPYDGEVFYIKSFLSSDLSKRCFDELFSKIKWEHDEYQMFGKKILTKRKVAWYGSKPYLYKYSQISRIAETWIDPLEDLKKRAEKKAKTSFNTCLLNLYHNGSEGMSWHSDDEK
jgi:alkylated DNA repair dioxygenase AlkB